jgi:ABC-type branched-subunit amino acid transport system substrate-binding protein
MINIFPIRDGVGRAARRCAMGALFVLSMSPLSACTTTELAGLTPGGASARMVASMPAQERVGEGKTIIGLLSSLEPNNLSDGAEDSIYLAAKLAITSLKQGLATLEIRPLRSSGQSAREGAGALASAGAMIVISGGDQAISSAVAKVLGAKGIPTIALAAASDTGAQLYGAGLGTRGELGALMAEFARLNYAHIAVAVTVEATSQAYAAAVLNAAAGANIVASPIDASDPTLFLAGLAELAHTSTPDAIVFASGPARAAELVGALRAVPAQAGIAIVGNAHWATAEPLGKALSGAWYASLPRDGLARFVARFKAAYGSNPTLTGALVYDLIIMAAALPEVVPETPYAPEVLRTDSGFGGFLGPFRFGAANLAEPREYTIANAR